MWGIAGERGPEAVAGPATVIPMRNAGMKVEHHVHNHAGAKVANRETRTRDGVRIETVIEAAMVEQLGRRGSRVNRAMKSRGAGLPLQRF